MQRFVSERSFAVYIVDTPPGTFLHSEMGLNKQHKESR
jgi:hypothetical protein